MQAQTVKPIPIVRLVCGDFQNLGDISEVLEFIGENVETFFVRCRDFLGSDGNTQLMQLGPYCGRAFLESACNAFIGRLDPVRLLHVRRIQSKEGYKVEERNVASIWWAGDVVTKNEPKETDVTRALLAKYTDEILWKPGFERLLDSTSNNAGSIWLSELQKYTPEGIGYTFRNEAGDLYSSLSKGVHQEFVTPQTTKYDNTTVQNFLKRTIKLVSMMALITHYIPVSLARVESDQALVCFFEIEKLVDD